MRTDGRLVVRLMAVAMLVLGMVVMHHVVRSDDDASATHQAPATTTMTGDAGNGMTADVAATDDGAGRSGMGDDAPSAGHAMLHLCLAILTAAFLVAAGWLLLAWRPWRTAWRSRLIQVWRGPARSPPRPHGSALLTSLCVMRT